MQTFSFFFLRGRGSLFLTKVTMSVLYEPAIMMFCLLLQGELSFVKKLTKFF